MNEQFHLMVQKKSSCLSKWPVHLWFFWVLINFTHTHTDTQVHPEVSLSLFPSFPMVVPKCFNSQLRTKNQDHWKPLDLKNGLRIMVYSTKPLDWRMDLHRFDKHLFQTGSTRRPRPWHAWTDRPRQAGRNPFSPVKDLPILGFFGALAAAPWRFSDGLVVGGDWNIGEM